MMKAHAKVHQHHATTTITGQSCFCCNNIIGRVGRKDANKCLVGWQKPKTKTQEAVAQQADASLLHADLATSPVRRRKPYVALLPLPLVHQRWCLSRVKTFYL
jgi:hypothetical protein